MFEKDNTVIYSLGNKGRDAFARQGYTVKASYPDVMEAPMYADAVELTNTVLKDFENGEIGEIYIAYTFFKNTVSHEPRLLKLLPVECAKEDNSSEKDEYGGAIMNFDMEDSAAIDLMIPKYISSLIYGALMEAVASENGARMQAMDNATSNAEDMIQNLSLMYNRARQGSITQELTEIIAGAEAIG
ncbi:MAG: F0F1 ATP synthase subunit gamma, partial [Lachnospiraceae bacterium]|nr:F0F1 ATP synthase subunit gamma [Lachnospiraceae bacterium]